ncbi:hypothetical protein ACXA45_08795 [Neomicrococcus lactis]
MAAGVVVINSPDLIRSEHASSTHNPSDHGSGKGTAAHEVVRALGCALLSVDAIEAAMRGSGIERDQPAGLPAYVVDEDLARE